MAMGEVKPPWATYDPSLERLDREQLVLHQLARLQPLLAEVLAHNPFYRRRFAAAGLTDARAIGTLDDFRQLPFTVKADLSIDQESYPLYGSNLTYPPQRYIRLLRTSGTTGRPLRWLETEESLTWGARNWVASYHTAGVTRDDRIFFAFSFGPFLAYWGAWEGARLLGAMAISGGAQSSAERLHFLLENDATVLACTPTYALRLAEVAAEQRLDLRNSAVRLIMHGGEPGACIPSTKARIEDVWGARSCDTAGSTETGHWGSECSAARCDLHVDEVEFIAEVIDPERLEPVPPGTPGELVLTNFGRWGMPLFRYRTRDRVVATEDRCACGRTTLRLQGGVLGRTDDMLVVRGVNVFPSALENIIRGHETVAEYQIEVRQARGMRELFLRLEPTPALDGADATAAVLARVLDDLHRHLQLRLDGEVVPPGTLPRFELKARRVVIRDDSR
jgi:phenylacetate-CoA ligase